MFPFIKHSPLLPFGKRKTLSYSLKKPALWESRTRSGLSWSYSFFGTGISNPQPSLAQ